MTSQNEHKLSCGKITADDRITAQSRPTELYQDNTCVLNDSADVGIGFHRGVGVGGVGEAPSCFVIYNV